MRIVWVDDACHFPAFLAKKNVQDLRHKHNQGASRTRNHFEVFLSDLIRVIKLNYPLCNIDIVVSKAFCVEFKQILLQLLQLNSIEKQIFLCYQQHLLI